MNIFVYEWTCATGGDDQGLAGALHTEGWAMLSAICKDFACLPHVLCWTLLAENLPDDLGPRCQRFDAREEPDLFRQLAAAADATLVIAPECDGLLRECCNQVVDVGGRLLGPLPEAIALTSDKLCLARHWEERGVPTPGIRGQGSGVRGQGQGVRDEGAEVKGQGKEGRVLAFPLVCKPRWGAGSQATFLVPKEEDLEATLQAARQEMDTEFLLQAFVPGMAASVAFLIGRNQPIALAPAFQHLSSDGRFHYLGGELPLPAPLAERAIRLGRQAVEAVPGLRGYVGVDLLLGEAADGSGDVAIEINPRLTTSYLGLRQLAEDNLADLMLRVVAGEQITPRWRDGGVRFSAAGRIEKLGTPV